MNYIKSYTSLRVLRFRAAFMGIDLFANLYVTTHRKESYDHGEEERMR